MAVIFRDACRADVPAILALLMDDPLGAAREGAPIKTYLAAFDDIAATPSHQLIVGEKAGEIVACCQLTLLYGLSRKGGRRALVEAVRVAPKIAQHGDRRRADGRVRRPCKGGGCKCCLLYTSRCV